MNDSQQRNAPIDQDRLEAQFAARLTGLLSASLSDLDSDTLSRLRFAREQALARAATAAPAVQAVGGGALALGRLGPWWPRLGSLLPLLVLAASLMLAQDQRQREAVAVAAEIDSALLADELPPEAYADPGFVAFLKLQQP